MTDIKLHIYDVTGSGSEKTDNTIVQFNNFLKDTVGVGGIFHSAIQVYGDEEWSFGYTNQGSGVFSNKYGKNSTYRYRECIVLGKTKFSVSKVNQIIEELSQEWAGKSYDLLSRNCNHFCDELCARLGVPKPPVWVNRFASTGDVARTWLKQARKEIIGRRKEAFNFLSDVAKNYYR